MKALENLTAEISRKTARMALARLPLRRGATPDEAERVLALRRQFQGALLEVFFHNLDLIWKKLESDFPLREPAEKNIDILHIENDSKKEAKEKFEPILKKVTFEDLKVGDVICICRAKPFQSAVIISKNDDFFDVQHVAYVRPKNCNENQSPRFLIRQIRFFLRDRDYYYLY